MKQVKKYISFLTLFTLCFSFISPAFAASINSVDKYAWSDETGWINFNPSSGNVDVSDMTITGNAWSDTYGWINLAPTNGGITNDAEGKTLYVLLSSEDGAVYDANFTGEFQNDRTRSEFISLIGKRFI